MQPLADAIEYLNDALFIALAVVALRQWRTRRDEASSWVAATFGILAAVVVFALFLPETGDALWLVWTRKVLIAVLLLFPYTLYRFAGSFQRPGRAMALFATAATGAIIVASFVLPPFPEPGDPRPLWLAVYVYMILVQWTVLSTYVSIQLWRAGAGQPTLARRRMRILAAAAAVLDVALLLQAVFPNNGEASALLIVVRLLSTMSVVLFFGAFAPPALIRISWRRPEEQALQQAQLGLMAATRVEDVVSTLLPHGVRVVGATSGALIDTHGHVIGCHGVSADWAAEHAPDPHALRLPLRQGQLVLWTGPHSPYFGREELDLLTSFGVVIDLAWERCDLLEHQRQTTARLEQAQQIARLGAWEWDMLTAEVVWSDEMYRMLDMTPGDDIPSLEDYLEHVHPDDRARLVANMDASQQFGRPFDMDYRFRLADGSIRTIHGQGQVVAGPDGTPRRMIGTAHDITERKMTEEVLSAAYEGERNARLAFERANAELESFVYSVSHDLKSPIISVLGYLDYLKLDFGTEFPPEAMHYIERIASSANYMEALIQDLLELSRVGRVQTERSDVDLDALAHEAADEAAAGHPDASVTIESLPVLSVNPLRARQLFTNLIGNALVHSGKPDVHVRISSEMGRDGGATILVEDDGRGIPEAYLDRVFGVFERLDSSGDGAMGTGIGLAICRKVMDALGGSITADPVESGTRIRMRFPAEAVRAATTPAGATQP